MKKENFTKKDKENKGKEKFIRFLEKYFKLIRFFSAVLILVLGVFLVVFPKYEKVREIRKIVGNEGQLEYENNLVYLENIKDIRNSFRDLKKEDIEKINSILPAESQKEDLIIEIETLAMNSGLALASLEIDSGEDDSNFGYGSGYVEDYKEDSAEEAIEGVETVKISAEIIGVNYSGLKSFLNSVENNIKIMDIKELNFSPGEKKLSVKINAYFLD